MAHTQDMTSTAAGKQVSLSVSAAAVTMREDAGPSSGSVAGATAQSSSSNGARPAAKAGAVKKVSLISAQAFVKVSSIANCLSYLWVFSAYTCADFSGNKCYRQ